MDLIFKVIKFALILALIVAVLDAFGLSAENSYFMFMGFFHEYKALLLHPIALIIYALIALGYLSQMMKYYFRKR